MKYIFEDYSKILIYKLCKGVRRLAQCCLQ